MCLTGADYDCVSLYGSCFISDAYIARGVQLGMQFGERCGRCDLVISGLQAQAHVCRRPWLL